MELKDTIEMMTSEDYKERFKAEYSQLKIRLNKLTDLNNKIEASKRSGGSVEEPAHNCPHTLLRRQQSAMSNYLRLLQIRAVIEGIALD